jgi:hypothetical protein
MALVSTALVAALLGLGGVALRRVWRRGRAPRPLGAEQLVTSVEWFPAGDVGRLRGVVVATGEPLVAPLTGRVCVGYELIVTEYADEATTELIRDVRWASFALDDGTGRALIDLTVEPVTLTLGTIRTSSGFGDDATVGERAVLARHQHHPDHGGVMNRNLTYRERAIVVGELISVRGVGVREADPSPVAATLGRGAPPTRLRLVSTGAIPLTISALPADLSD